MIVNDEQNKINFTIAIVTLVALLLFLQQQLVPLQCACMCMHFDNIKLNLFLFIAHCMYIVYFLG